MSKLPTWEGFVAPILSVLADGEVRSLRALRRDTSDYVGLTETQRAEALASGQSRADNRIGWAASYLTRVDAVERPTRGQYRITEIGRTLLDTHPVAITEEDLKLIAKDGDEWWKRSTPSESQQEAESEADAASLDPVEQIDQGIERIRDEVAADLLRRLGDEDPAFFEAAVVKLLLAMGYGGTGGGGSATSLVNDGGIDGIINQDVLGLDKVFIQAKRYAATVAVQRPEVQAFVGALSGKANAGVFITTSRFSTGAVEYAETAHARVILIDGKRLTELMIDYGVGVQSERTVHIVRVDEDFFT